MDPLDKKQRSLHMSLIRAENSRPEILLRSILHRLGFRFRVNVKSLPGKPDIVLRKHQAVIFVHGCFWHAHPNCKRARIPSSNRRYWKKKFERNKEKDAKNIREIKRLGWRPCVVWECQVMKSPQAVARRVFRFLTGSPLSMDDSSYDFPEKRELLHVAEKRRNYLIRKKKTQRRETIS